MIQDELNNIGKSIEQMENLYYKYWHSEYNFAIEEMKKLGINTEAQTFEQCVNTLIAIAKGEIDVKRLKEYRNIENVLKANGHNVEIYNVQPGDDMQCGVGKNNI